MRKLIAMDIRLIDDRRVMADAAAVAVLLLVTATAAAAADDKNVGREEGRTRGMGELKRGIKAAKAR